MTIPPHNLPAVKNSHSGERLETERAADEAWPDLGVDVEPSLPRLEPGDYIGRSVGVERFELKRWGRRLIVYFDIFEANPLDGNGTVLARLPAYFRLPEQRRALRPTSKLARVFDLIDRRRRRLDRLPLTTLRHRLWKVRVRDVQITSGRALQRSQFYSVVADVLEHLG